MNMAIRIVLADDHEIVLEGLRSLLQNEDGFEVVGEATTGVQAYQLISEKQPDVAVLDIAMPDMDGIEVARKLKADNCKTRILALSMHSEREYVKGLFAAGASGYMLKESALVELLRAIRAVHEGRRFLSDELVDVVLGDDLDALDNAVSPFDPLTERELEVCKMVVEGKSTKEIAFDLGISPKTVDGHRVQIMRKLEIDSMVDLIRLAIREGMIEA
jgi:DNA-binding NarL/FixJ family response regulator